MLNEELLLRIRSRILSHPQEINMQYVWGGVTRGIRIFGLTVGCGTIGCIAGHAIELSGGCSKGVRGDTDGARILLGMSEKEADLLFYFHLDHEDNDGSPYTELRKLLRCYHPCTYPYAEVVAKAIDLCIERHREQAFSESCALDMQELVESSLDATASIDL